MSLLDCWLQIPVHCNFCIGSVWACSVFHDLSHSPCVLWNVDCFLCPFGSGNKDSDSEVVSDAYIETPMEKRSGTKGQQKNKTLLKLLPC